MNANGNSALDGLIKRLKVATGPDQELNADIYRAVVDEFAPSFTEYRGMVWSGIRSQRVPLYTSSIDDALKLVRGGWPWAILSHENGKFYAECNCNGWQQTGATAPLALCIAAITALFDESAEQAKQPAHAD